jgi:epsilon-lactone hydrolase
MTSSLLEEIMKILHIVAWLLVGLIATGSGIYLVSFTDGSVTMNLTRLGLGLMGKPLAHPDEFSRKILNRTGVVVAKMPEAFLGKYTINEEIINGGRLITLSPKSDPSGWNIIYTHGGAYVNEFSKPHWDIVEALIDSTSATITVPIYPLAPEFNNRDAFKFLVEVYKKTLLTTSAQRIVMSGDSAGAGLALGQVIEFRMLGLPLPSRVIAFAPWLDLTLSDTASVSVEPTDIMLGIEALRRCGLWWAAGDDPKTPRLSPLYADMHGMPPIDIFQGSLDLLSVDARSFVVKAKEAGGAVRYFEYPGAFHVFMAATFTPESKDVFQKIRDVLPPIRTAQP